MLITEKLLKFPVYLHYWTSVILRLVQHEGWLTLAWFLVSATCLISGQALIALMLLFTRNLGFGHLPLTINLGWTFYYIHALYIKCHLCLEVQKKINIYPWSWNDTQVDLHYHHARQNIIVCCKYNGTHYASVYIHCVLNCRPMCMTSVAATISTDYKTTQTLCLMWPSTLLHHR